MQELSRDIALRISGQATNAGAQLVKRKVRQNIIARQLIDTGSLRDAVIVKKIPRGQTQLTSEHIVTFRGRGKRHRKSKMKQAIAPHAVYIEFGTVNMAAEPVLAPAFDSEKGRAVEAIADRLRKRIEAVRPK